MPSLFGVDIAGIIGQAIGPGVLPATLIKVYPGSRSPGDLANGTNSDTVSHPCRGFMDSSGTNVTMGAFLETTPGDLMLEQKSIAITLIGDTLPAGVVPVGGDRVTIEGATYAISSVKRDPVGATYELACRGL